MHRANLTCAVAILAILCGQGQALGQQDEPSKVESLEVTAPLVPVPDVGEGAPLYGVTELRALQDKARREGAEAWNNSRTCNKDPMARAAGLYAASNKYALWKLYNDEAMAKLDLMTAARTAAEASEAAVIARRDAAAGKVSREMVVASELARQAAVRRMLERRTVAREIEATIADVMQVTNEGGDEGEIRRRIDQRFFNGGVDAIVVDAAAAENLKLVDVRAVETIDVPPTFVVTGRVENPTRRAVAAPALSFTAVDQFGWALETKVADSGKDKKIRAGKSLPFAYEFVPKPSGGKTVLVTFADARSSLLAAIGMFCSRAG